MQETQTTTIDGKQYMVFGDNQSNRFALREENNKILVYSSILKKDLVLYDFTLEVGDSLPALYFVWRVHDTMQQWLYIGDIVDYNKDDDGTILPADTFVVTDISTITLLDGKEYKKWTFNNGMQYVEGIGSFGTSYAWNDFFQLIANGPQYSDAVSEHLVCVSKNGKLLYQLDEAEMDSLGVECLCDGYQSSYKSQWCDTWNVFVENGSVYPPHEETYRYQLAQDTVIGEHTYTAVVSKAINDALDAPHYVAAVRFTDDRKVYIYYDNAEYLLYDFKVQEGDELEVFAGINNYTTETKTYKCRVTSIEQYTCIGCPATITLHVQNNDLTQVYRETQWIEGVGDINGFLNGLNGYINIPGNAAEYLLCAYKEGVQVYTSKYGEEFGCEFNGVHTEDADTIPLYTGDDPGSSTVDPIDPNQVVVTLNGNELNIKESSGDEINYSLVLNKNKQAPTKEQIVQANSFIHSVSIELFESGYYTLQLTNPNWDSSLVGHFQYINTAIEEVQGDEKFNAKILRDGQLLIRVGERLYTPTGMQIQ
ncbi:MAG: hypothetical protein UIB40_02450 [Paludibacteraceae bacterium]|nr:hypothetical protein [Paludibacteraceae bacterium]